VPRRLVGSLEVHPVMNTSPAITTTGDKRRMWPTPFDAVY
jgi:hypothetical protein